MELLTTNEERHEALPMASEAKPGGTARLPLQPRDNNVVASLAVATALAKSKVNAREALLAVASPPSVRSYANRAKS